MTKLTLLPKDFNQYAGIYLTALLLAIIAIVYVATMSTTMNQPVNVNSFSECAELKNSVIQEKYPPVCVTEDGQHFTQPTPQASNSSSISE